MRFFLPLFILFICLFNNNYAQESTPNEAIYRRSSLCVILMDEAKTPKRDTIKAAFLSAPIPEKYNDHNIRIRLFSPDTMQVTSQDYQDFQTAIQKATEGTTEQNPQPKKKGGFGKAFSSFAKSVASPTPAKKQKTDEYAVLANKFLIENQVAKQIFDKWFRDSLGNFSMQLIQERGRYDASVMDVQTARNSKRGKGLLEDAGEELINNTFVVVTRFNYLSKDELCAEIDAAAQLIAAQFNNQYAALGAKAGVLALKASLGAGYYVKTSSFLFQLNWNPEIAQTFYEELWDNPEAYENADIFGLKYIGKETAWANVKASIFTQKTEDELIRIATINATDAVLAKLEKKYEVFHIKTPLFTVEPEITAQIGLKEGLEGGDKFEVLEQTVDPETNRTYYKRKGTLKVSKGHIWDNRYMADAERELTGKTQDFKATLFEGSNKGLYPGMFIRQIK